MRWAFYGLAPETCCWALAGLCPLPTHCIDQAALLQLGTYVC